MTEALRTIQAFLSEVMEWAKTREDVAAIILVGSHVRSQAQADSDVDLVILTHSPGTYLEDPSFAEVFGAVVRSELEDWGRVTSLRVWYRDGLEVEFGLTTPDWIVENPLDESTIRVISNGAKVVVDRVGGLDAIIASYYQG